MILLKLVLKMKIVSIVKLMQLTDAIGILTLATALLMKITP